MNAQLEAILDLTDQVQNAIDAGEWQRANELESERRRLLERVVADQAASNGLGDVLGRLEQRNSAMIGVVRDNRRRVLREAASLKSATAGATAYASAPSDG